MKSQSCYFGLVVLYKTEGPAQRDGFENAHVGNNREAFF